MGPRRLPVNSRKLLVAAVGVAAVSYVACGGITEGTQTSGNLMAYDAGQDLESGGFPTSGNLMAPADATVVDSGDAGADAAPDDAGDANVDADQ
jgi:hypothetical protein